MAGVNFRIGRVRTRTSGLEWAGNEATPFAQRMLYWASPFHAYGGAGGSTGYNASGTAGGNGCTYIFKCYPKGPKSGTPDPDVTYWSALFHCNNGSFTWGAGSGQSYYGAHPYPFKVANGHPFTGQAMELSIDTLDLPPSAPDAQEMTWNQWYTCVVRAWQPDANSRVTEFYWDFDRDNTKNISRTSDSGYVEPPSPIICSGQSPFDFYTGDEEFKGIIRGYQFYDGLLSVADVAQELTLPGSSTNGANFLWYLNTNPTVADTSDKSGNGNNPTWLGTDRPVDWFP